MTDQPFHSGFAYFVGQPNAGESILTNVLVDQRIATVSSKPQTTKHVVRGIVTCDSKQLMLIGIPGLYRPCTLLGGRLNEMVRGTQSEVDVVGVCLPCDQRIDPGDHYIVSRIAGPSNHPLLVTLAAKTDLVNKKWVFSHLADIPALADEFDIQWAEVIPCPTLSNDQVDTVHNMLLCLLPKGPMYYPDEEVTGEPEGALTTELVREAVPEGVCDRLPHSITVVIGEISPRPDRPEDKPLLDVFAPIVVERDSQKGIIIRHRRSRLWGIGTAARLQINRLLGTPVHLSLYVRMLREWQCDTRYLNGLGFQ